MCYRYFLFGFICIVPVGIVAQEAAAGAADRAPVYEPTTEDINARLARVEKILDNNALLDLHGLLESLKQEVNALRGELELQSHSIERLTKKQRELYVDIDRRLQGFERGDRVITVAEPVAEAVAAERTQQPAETPVENAGAAAAIAADGETETEITDTQPDPLKAEADYQRAFRLLKETRYDQALKAFRQFLQDHPNSTFSDNAQYWIGETHYVMQKYELAINEYQTLLNTYPDSQKVSHALLKIGYSYAELDNVADATKTLEAVTRQYPDTTAARLADERLRKIGSSTEPEP